MNGNRRKPVEEPEHVWQLFHHLRHWSVENLHHRRAADEVDDVLQGVPLDPFLRPGLGENPGPHPAGRLNHLASVVEHNGHVNDLVQEKQTATVGSRLSSHRQQRICWTCTTNIDHLVNVLQLGITVENHGNLHLRHDGDVDDMPRTLRTWRCTITGMSPSCPRTATVELHGSAVRTKPLSCTTRARHQNDDHNKDIEHRIKRLQLGNLCGLL